MVIPACSSEGSYPDDLADWIVASCKAVGPSEGIDDEVPSECVCHLDGLEKRVPAEAWEKESEDGSGFEMVDPTYEDVVSDVVSGCGLEAEVQTDPDTLDDLCPPGGLGTSDADLVIFLEVGADDQQIDAVGDAVEALEAVTSTEFVDEAAAVEEFQSMFPDRADEVDPGDLPVSFRLDVADETATFDEVQTVGAPLEGLPGVEKVVTNLALPGSPVC